MGNQIQPHLFIQRIRKDILYSFLSARRQGQRQGCSCCDVATDRGNKAENISRYYKPGIYSPKIKTGIYSGEFISEIFPAIYARKTGLYVNPISEAIILPRYLWPVSMREQELEKQAPYRPRGYAFRISHQAHAQRTARQRSKRTAREAQGKRRSSEHEGSKQATKQGSQRK